MQTHPDYPAETMFALAARVNNTKRSYLLVNPQQAKHIPVSPARAISMSKALAATLPAQCRTSPTLVIGFAETATAVGAVMAAALGTRCRYMHTTREALSTNIREVLHFSEVHSHATAQLLCTERLRTLLTDVCTVVLVDDELTTGNTILNLLARLRPYLPQGCRVLAASLINRMNRESREKFEESGVGIAALCFSEDTDATEAAYTAATGQLCGAVAKSCAPARSLPGIRAMDFPFRMRLGENAAEYRAACLGLADAVQLLLPKNAARVLLLGTEECMAPALWAGAALELQLPDCAFFCHATTRSPISVCDRADYPIRSGVRLPSLYDAARTTYLYNLAAYDCAVIITDAPHPTDAGLAALTGALRQAGSTEIFLLQLV